MGPDEIDGEFGFVTLDRTHTLTSFEAYAKWAKALHFGLDFNKVPLTFNPLAHFFSTLCLDAQHLHTASVIKLM